jgi:hypothetical protein
MRFEASVLAILTLAGCSPSADEGPPSTGPSGIVGSEVRIEGRVDVGGYELAYICQGQGAPTVVLEAGYDSPGIETFADLIDSIAQTTRVCTYDRAGTGTSDAPPKELGLEVSWPACSRRTTELRRPGSS